MKSIKIAVIAYSCRSGGGLVQTINLLKALKNVSQQERYLIICPANCGYEGIELPPHSSLYVYRDAHTLYPRLKFEYIKLPRIVADYAPDVIFSPANVGLAKPPAPQAIYVRNGYFFYGRKHYPDMHLRMRLRFMLLRRQMKQFIDASEWIFCQTPVVKERFCRAYSYPKDRVTVLGFPPPTEIALAAKTDVPVVVDQTTDTFYVLVLTDYMPHRNPHVLIPLCDKYAGQLRKHRVKFITTVNTKDNRRSKIFLRDVTKKHFDDIIINVGQLCREEVAAYLQAADVLWLPTLMECLPTPYLEAMSVGLAILAPDLDFAKYVCEEAAVYYDPWDIDSMFEKIMLLRENQEISQVLVSKGKLQLQNSNKFPQNWEEVALTILQELRKLVT